MTSNVRLHRSRRSLLLAPLLLVCCLAAALFAAPAGAVVTAAAGHQFGVQPETAAAGSETALTYENGPVVHASAPYAVFWDPASGSYSGQWEERISEFLERVGSDNGLLSNVFAVATQYRDATGNAANVSSFRGAYTDIDHFPNTENCSEGTPCLTDAQLRTELSSYIAANGLPSGLNAASGPTPIYFVFTPPGITVCLDATGEHCSKKGSAHPLCSYHSFIPAGGTLPATVLYAVEPWTAGNRGTVGVAHVSGADCQDGSGTIQEPNQIPAPGLGPEGEYNAGLADLIINNVADQWIATTTNPLFNGWRNTGNGGDEEPDKCRNDFLGGLLAEAPGTETGEHTEAGTAFNQLIGGGEYYLNDEFDQAGLFTRYPGVPCINQVNFSPNFTATNPARSGDPLTFNATESDVDLGVAAYHWDFGDQASASVNCEGRTPTFGFAPEECNGSSGIGNPNAVASVVHQYTYGGTYPVTLTLTDDAGHTASITREISVSGPAPPTPQTPSSGGSTQAAQTTTSAPGAPSTAAPGSAAKPGAKPVATQAVVSHSLSSVLKGGLVIRYSVNQQVAGRFEVLLASSVARKIGLPGATATGLAKGTAPQTIIAKAILVTTKGGHSTYKIKFSKSTAARLRKLAKVSLMIRLVVHNAASPAVTTVLNTVDLSR